MNKTFYEQTHSEDRGSRLKGLRLMAGLSRREVETRHGVSMHTQQAWESGRIPLSEKGAKRMIEAYKNEGLSCSLDWLLHGAGGFPYPLPIQYHGRRNGRENQAGQHGYADQNSIQTQPTPLTDEDYRQQELALFRQLNGDTLQLELPDDSMGPHYSIGDLVAGKRCFNEEIRTMLYRTCIVETMKGKCYLRQLMPAAAFNNAGFDSSSPDRYHLIATNPSAPYSEPVLADVEVHSAAAVIWHRRLSDALMDSIGAMSPRRYP